MSTARSVFTEAIEEHLALKKQNTGLEPAMPLARYDVGDPLDRYPGGPNRTADAGTMVVSETIEDVASEFDAEPVAPATSASPLLVGPSPEQAMEAATALETAFGDRPFEPLTGMAPMLSLVEDIDEDDDVIAGSPFTPAAFDNADVLRFPGGVGPRDEQAPEVSADQTSLELPSSTLAPQPLTPSPSIEGDHVLVHDAPTGEQPVLVIDADEPLAGSDWAEPAATARSSAASRKKPRFFGLGRKKSSSQDQADGWFTDGPRDFNWD